MNKQTARRLAQCAHQAASADNSQPWLFRWEGEHLVIAYDTQRVQGNTFPPLNPATLLAVGGCIENIEQYAKENHLSIHCDYRLSEQEGNFEFARVSLQSPAPDTDRLPHPNLTRHTNRNAFHRTPIPSELLTPIQTQYRGSTKTKVFTETGDIAAWRRLIYLASEIRFQTQEVHEWLGKSLRFPNQHSAQEGLDIRTLALPPGGGAFLRLISDWQRMSWLNKVGTYKALSTIDSAPLAKAPALVAVIGGIQDREIIDSGKLLNAVWTELNRHNLAVHPYYVIPDLLYRLRQNQIPGKLLRQAELVKKDCQRLLGLGDDETLHMILRVGYPKKQFIPSQRLPLDTVFRET